MLCKKFGAMRKILAACRISRETVRQGMDLVAGVHQCSQKSSADLCWGLNGGCGTYCVRLSNCIAWLDCWFQRLVVSSGRSGTPTAVRDVCSRVMLGSKRTLAGGELIQLYYSRGGQQPKHKSTEITTVQVQGWYKVAEQVLAHYIGSQVQKVRQLT